MATDADSAALPPDESHSSRRLLVWTTVFVAIAVGALGLLALLAAGVWDDDSDRPVVVEPVEATVDGGSATLSLEQGIPDELIPLRTDGGQEPPTPTGDDAAEGVDGSLDRDPFSSG